MIIASAKIPTKTKPDPGKYITTVSFIEKFPDIIFKGDIAPKIIPKVNIILLKNFMDLLAGKKKPKKYIDNSDNTANTKATLLITSKYFIEFAVASSINTKKILQIVQKIVDTDTNKNILGSFLFVRELSKNKNKDNII